MSEIITVGLDLAKNVFQAHVADASGKAVLRKRLRRDQVLAFFGQLQPCVVAMEACGGSHFWGREIGKLGHEVRLIPPAYVKPFVKRQKNDAADAEAICEAAQRPTMRFVPVKSEGAHARPPSAPACSGRHRNPTPTACGGAAQSPRSHPEAAPPRSGNAPVPTRPPSPSVPRSRDDPSSSPGNPCRKSDQAKATPRKSGCRLTD